MGYQDDPFAIGDRVRLKASDRVGEVQSTHADTCYVRWDDDASPKLDFLGYHELEPEGGWHGAHH